MKAFVALAVMIVVTGASGFIGSCLIGKLNKENFNAIIAVDEFQTPAKSKNLSSKTILEKVERNSFFSWLDRHYVEVEFIFHLGARTDTTLEDQQIFDELNVNYSKTIWNKCIDYQIPLIYASSAATYGDGTLGFNDDDQLIDQLQPLNAYGRSKNDFDKWALGQNESPFFWAGFKFFNVYGPNEFHKGRMASVVFHAFNQISEMEEITLFRSHHPDFEDGAQARDFIYVQDLVNVIYATMHQRKHKGIYNLGTGNARTFKDLAHAVFKAFNKTPNITYIDTPEDLRDKYQYFTQADMTKLNSLQLNVSFSSLEEGVEDYVRKYLIPSKYY